MVVQDQESVGEDCQLRKVALGLYNDEARRGHTVGGGLALECIVFASKLAGIRSRWLWRNNVWSSSDIGIDHDIYRVCRYRNVRTHIEMIFTAACFLSVEVASADA